LAKIGFFRKNSYFNQNFAAAKFKLSFKGDRARVSCCEFITQIMKNFTEKEEVLQKPFSDSIFEPIYSSLSNWHDKKAPQSRVVRDRSLESMTWLCHGLPWNRFGIEKINYNYL